MAFEPPSAEGKRAAVGYLSELAPTLQRAFAADAPEFEPIPQPGPNDWLALHDEAGQTFDEFRASHPNRPAQDRHTFYLQPLGNFTSGRSPSIEKLREFAAAFFAMEPKRYRRQHSTLQSLPAAGIHIPATRKSSPATCSIS
jgi:archaemetzincin